MACTKPNRVVRYKANDSWKFVGPQTKEIVPSIQDRSEHCEFVSVPCGTCEECYIERRYSNALRIMLEATCHEEKTYFITLTFNNENVGNNELNHNEWSQFIKQFRQVYCQAKYCKIKDRGSKRHGKEYSKTFKNIKQVMSGEYGDSFGRKHFHGIIFNHNFTDQYFTGFYSKKGNPIHSSKSLEQVWRKGNVQIEEITHDLALYVGSYLTDRSDDEDQSEGKQKRQYGRMGNGIGLEWIKRYWKDVLVKNAVSMNDADHTIPRYFHKKIEELHPKEYAEYKQKKMLKFKSKAERIIKKGEGPLLRSKTKGKIRQLINKKGALNEAGKKQFSIGKT